MNFGHLEMIFVGPSLVVDRVLGNNPLILNVPVTRNI
jgi:hypothetical protein